MKKVVISFLILTSSLQAQEGSLYQEAQSALREGIPQVCIQKLKVYLTEELSAKETRRANLDLAQAYLTLKKTNDAREVLTKLTIGEDVQYFFVQSYLTDNNWREVNRRLIILPSQASLFYPLSVFARAEARRGLMQPNLAAEDYKLIENDPNLGNAARLRLADLLLEKNTSASAAIHLINTDDLAALQLATLLTAQRCLLSKDYSQAERHFRSLLDNPTQLSSFSYAAIHLGLANCLIELTKLDEASDLLEKFIDARPNHKQLDDIFSVLDYVYQKEKNPSPTQLRRWSKDAGNPSRQALSIYYQSQFDLRDKGSDAALATLSGWLDKFTTHPLRSSVLLKYGEQLVTEKKLSEGIRRLNEGLALPASPVTKGKLHTSLALALFQNNSFTQAAGHFLDSSELLTSSSESLLYNSALSWLRDSNFEQFLKAYQRFSGLFPNSNLRRDLLIEEGFLQARLHQLSEAKNTLNLFLRDFPEHPRVADAHLALAEISQKDSPANTERELVLAVQSKPTKDITERSAYLRFFQKSENDKANFDSKTQIAHCESYLKEYPGSTFEAEVRFKLGEAYFAEKNYTAAGTQFELISANFPGSALLEQARFLAGQSAIRTMNPSAVDGAIALFEQVVRMKGPLQAYARFEQATVKKNLASYDEALALYNDLLSQKPQDDLLAPTLAAKAETLYLQGSDNPKKISESVATFDQLSMLPGISRYWRNLALYKKGKGLQWLGKKEEMLSAYYDTLTLPTDPKELPEYYWFYRAGFDAAEALEIDEQWEAAIAIYRKLAEAKGPRAQEAEDRIKRLRLEHFIWEK